MITIFTTKNCPRCKALEKAMQETGLEFQKREMDAQAISDCLCDTGEHTTSAPLVKTGAIWYFASDLFSPAGDLLPNWQAILKGNRPTRKAFSGEGGLPSTKLMDCKGIWRT